MHPYDRRSARRARWTGLTFIHDGKAAYIGVGADISASGLLVVIAQPHWNQVDSVVRLKFALPGRPCWISLQGVPVRVVRRGSRIAIGVRFQEMTPDIRLQLQTYVNSCLHRPPPIPQPTRVEPAADPPSTCSEGVDEEPTLVTKHDEKTRRVRASELQLLTSEEEETRWVQHDAMMDLRRDCRGAVRRQARSSS